MAVPEVIRKVERPKNTVVVEAGKPGPFQYAVRERKTAKYVPGENPKPRNGKTIGHIFQGRFVPVSEPVAEQGEYLSYGLAALLYREGEDLMSDLLAVYPIDVACSIFTMACLKVQRPRIPNCKLASTYERSFLTEYFPGMALSKNTVTNLLKRLGMDLTKQRAFYKRRLDRVAIDEHVAIDGSLIQDTSIINDLSHYTSKGRVSGCNNLSLMYAYNIEKLEPICAQVFPGNQIDAVAYKTFLKDKNIYRNRCYAYIMDRERSYDIDSAFDVKLVEAIIQNQK